jgi:hypothetical protein
MSEAVAYQGAGAAARDRAHTLFAQTMGYVAATAALFGLGAYLGRNLAGGATALSTSGGSGAPGISAPRPCWRRRSSWTS